MAKKPDPRFHMGGPRTNVSLRPKSPIVLIQRYDLMFDTLGQAATMKKYRFANG